MCLRVPRSNMLQLYQDANKTKMELERKTAENALLRAAVAQMKMEAGTMKMEKSEREAKLQVGVLEQVAGG